MIPGIHKLFSGEANKDFSPLTSQWEDFVLDTLQHKAVLKVLPHNLKDHTDHNNVIVTMIIIKLIMIITMIIIKLIMMITMMITMIMITTMIRSQSEAPRLQQ